MKDAGYDVSDFRAIDPVFGTLADAKALIAEAHAHGPAGAARHRAQPPLRPARVVPGGLARGPGLARARALHLPSRPRPGRAEPPNDWHSNFGGPSWTRIAEADGSPGEWYLHLFTPEQPDLNWDEPRVHAEFER